MGKYSELAQRFTDVEYLSKKDIKNIVGDDIVDLVWNETLKYRESFKKPINITLDDGIPFSLSFIPSLYEYIDVLNGLLDELKLKFDVLNKSNDPRFISIRKTILTNEIFYISKYYNLNLTISDIELIINSSLGFNDNITNISKAYKYVLNYEQKIDKDIIINLYNLFSSSNEELKSNRISYQFIDSILDISNKDNDILISSSFIYFIILNNSHLSSYSPFIAYLLSLKNIKDKGFGQSILYISFIKNLYKNHTRFKKAVEDSLESFDITYFVIEYMQNLIESIDETLESYNSIKNIKEYLIEAEEDIKINIEDIENEENEKISNSSSNYLNIEYIKPINNRQDYDFKEDPFNDKKQNKIDNNQSSNNTNKDLFKIIKEFLDEEPNKLALRLLHLDPQIKKHQASFYANNHDFNQIYTVQQYKQYCNVSYETARSSMVLLESFNLYKSEYYKNKLVYRPIHEQ